MAKTIEQEVGLPSKGATRPRTTVAEHQTPDMNAWVPVAEKMFNKDGKKWHFYRAPIKDVGQAYDCQKIQDVQALGYEVLWAAEGSDYHQSGMAKGAEAVKCVGNPNYVLLGLPWATYAARKWEEHERTNGARPLPIDGANLVTKVERTSEEITVDQLFAGRDDK